MLMHLKKILFKKTLFTDFLFLAIIQSIYFIPLLIFGLDRIEDYQYNHFSVLVLVKNFFSPFIFFYDLLGPGTRLPLGSGLYFFFPTVIFIENLKIFYFLTFIFGLYIQLNYLKKIFKFFKFKNPYILCLFYAFNIEILWQVFVGDSLKTFISVSSFPLIFYYLIKYLNLQTKYYLFKLILIVGYLILNTHEAFMLANFLGFFLLIIFNKKFFFLKEKYFYFGVVFFILIISENFYRLGYELTNFEDVFRQNILNLQLKHYFSGIVLFLKFFERLTNVDLPFLSEFKAFDNFWLPFGGIVFYFAFYETFRLIIKGTSEKIYYINYVFLSLIIISCLDLKNFSLSIISSSWLLRDINNFFSILLFGYFLKNLINLKLKRLIIICALIFTALHIFLTVDYQYKELKDQKYNFFKSNNNYKETVFYNKINSDYNKDIGFGKTYLSKEIWNSIKERRMEIFLEANIFYFNDLIRYNIYPFNSEFKNAHKNQLRSPTEKMYSVLDPRQEEINNEIFLNLFNIDFLMISKKEEELIDLSKYEILSRIEKKDEEIIFLKLKNFNKNVVINFDQKIIENFKCKKIEVIKCLLKHPSLFESSEEIQIKRISLNKYEIKNMANIQQKIVLPFLYDSSWKTKKKRIENIKDSIMYLELEPNSKIEVYYQDNVRIFLKLLSIITFVLMTIFLFRIKKTD